jgi:hypothetical protein
MKPSTRRTLLVAVIALIILAIGFCTFVERTSAIQEAEAEGFIGGRP